MMFIKLQLVKSELSIKHRNRTISNLARLTKPVRINLKLSFKRFILYYYILLASLTMEISEL